MGVMIEGNYIADDPGPDTTLGGEFKRAAATIRGWITDPNPARYHFSSRGIVPGRIARY